jgi:hypothetical protein
MTARWADILGPFLSKGSLNTFPQQQIRTQYWCSKKGTVISVVRATVVAKQRHLYGNESKHNNRRAVFSM